MRRALRLARRIARSAAVRLKTMFPEGPGTPLTLVETLGQRERTALTRLTDVWHAPAFGVLFDDHGQVLQASVRQALALTPNLDLLPGVGIEDGQPVFRAPRDAPTLNQATVFMGWGGLHNYARFVLDGLPALLTAVEAGAPEAITPPLLPWHRDLLDLMLGQGSRPRVIEAPLVRIRDAVFATAADGAQLSKVRERILTTVATDPAAGPKRLYVSRLGSHGQALTNELDLETALAARDFQIVRPETLSARQLVTLFHQADVIVAASGPALANLLFCRPGAKVIEIQPGDLAGTWAGDLAALAGLDRRVYPAPAAPEQIEVYLEGAHRPRDAFRWTLDLPAFLLFLDLAL